uniref:Protein kinase domain-containing protein n=1 Tax=Denticeps clupeoides TaxID=299321 RepID=A0AAY4BWN4_9TELE
MNPAQMHKVKTILMKTKETHLSQILQLQEKGTEFTEMKECYKKRAEPLQKKVDQEEIQKLLNGEKHVQRRKEPLNQEVQKLLNVEKEPLNQEVQKLLNDEQQVQEEKQGPLKFKDPCEDYKILKCIGQGAFGKVHKARNLKTGHLCMLLESLNHQNIAKVYICMELCKGGDLDNIYMCTGSLKESQVAFVAKEVLAALLYLHQKGYVHRDIKPNNILLTDTGEVRLVDFGLMSRIQKGKPTPIVGTPAYLAPEFVLEYLSGDYDERCDVWSLGITLLELHTSRNKALIFDI